MNQVSLSQMRRLRITLASYVVEKSMQNALNRMINTKKVGKYLHLSAEARWSFHQTLKIATYYTMQ